MGSNTQIAGSSNGTGPSALDYSAPNLNVPPPITSGSGIQTFTDAHGNVYVAANGVNNGAWKTASNVLHARLQKIGAWNSAASLTTLVYDGVLSDKYGLYNITTGIFTCPVAGFWKFIAQWGVGTGSGLSYTASHVYLKNGSVCMQNNVPPLVSVGYCGFSLIDQELLVPGDTIQFQLTTNPGQGGRLGNLTMFTIDFMGTG